MRILSALALSALASSALAQTLTTGLAPNNQGNVGGGLYFDLQINTTITITSLDMWAGSNTPASTSCSWELWLGPSTYVNNVTNAGLWTKVGTTTSAVATGGVYQLLSGLTVVPVPQIAAVTLGPGNYGFAFKSIGATNGYTNGVSCTSPTTPGTCTNSLFSTPHVTLRAGAAQNAFLTGGIFSPRIFSGNITYTVGGSPITFAQREPYGAGCYLKTRSFYEFWASSTVVDVANTSMRLTWDGVNNRWGPILGGTTAPVAVTSPNLNHTDDSNITIALLGTPILYPTPLGPAAATTVEMCSNGYINLNGTNPATGGNINPSVVNFLTGTPRIGYWHDFDPSGLSYTAAPATGATTNYDFDPVTGIQLFTWFNCPDSFRTTGNPANRSTFQIAFFPNGDVEFRWGTLVLGGGQWPTLIGFTNGGNAVDPGSRDLTASFPFSTDNADQAALKLEGDVNPVLGSTVNLTTSGVTGVNLGICFVCLADLPPFSPTGLDLGVIGAPGCVANVDINIGVGNLISNIGAPVPGLTVAFPIPAGPLTLLGQSFYCQSAWLDATQNPGGLISSNALRLRVGSF